MTEPTTPAPNPLGAVYLPANPGTPVGQFDFVLDKTHGESVEIGTPVTADTTEGTVVGVVVDMRTIGSDKDPMKSDLKGRNLGIEDDDPHRHEDGKHVRVATAQVFHSERMRPVGSGRVRPATAEEMDLATGMARIEWPIPVGVVPLADGSWARVCLNGETLLGTESAHLTIGGLSGQAAKTSFAGVALRSAIHAGSAESHSVAAIIFNVKGEDLVNLHEGPAAGYELSDEDLEMYAAMGVPATPFEDVTVYAPSLPGGGGTRSTREDAEPLRWDLLMVWPYLRYFFPGLFENDNMAAFLGDFEAMKLRAENSFERITTFDKLESFLDTEISNAEDADRSTAWRSHHIATMRRARKLLMGLPNRCGGLLTTGEAKAVDDVPREGWRHGQVVVVDIAGLETIVQAAVIARTCKRLLASAEDGGLGVDHLVIFADELNMFAPASGGELAPVKEILTKIAATGRYAGVSLWGAAQFMSQVHSQVRDNAATRAFGILAEAELDSGVYGRLPAGQRERVVTLPKGSVALKAYNLRGLMVTRFPRPAWRTGKPKTSAGGVTRRRTAVDTLRLNGKSVARLTEGLTADVVESVIAGADDPVKAVAALDAARVPDMRQVSVERPSEYDPTNPFDFL